MADLITVVQLEARLKDEFTGTDLAQVEALISDASALVNQVARTDFADVTSFPAGVPGTVVAVVAQILRRALDNPGELTAEQIGAYGWQSQHSSSISGGAIYLTRAERRSVRTAAGLPSFIAMPMTADPDAVLGGTE